VANAPEVATLAAGQVLKRPEFLISSSQITWKPFFLPLTMPLRLTRPCVGRNPNRLPYARNAWVPIRTPPAWKSWWPRAAVKNAGCVADQVTIGIVGTINSFELAQPENFTKGPVAVVDLGFKNSTISILLNGELSLSRVVAIGGDKLTTGLSEALGISYPEAEGIKIGMPEEVQSAIMPLLMPLGREL
jgi:hypothetical protein